MKRKISTERFIILIGIIFIAIILVVNIFADFVPHTLRSKDVPKTKITTQTATAPTKININTADVSLLAELKLVGEQRAKDIVTYRIRHGNFHTIREIINVPGIGEKIFELNKDRLTVK